MLLRTGLADARARFPVGLIGSAFKAGAMFIDPLTDAIHETAPRAEVSTVEMAPVGGSMLLAARACEAQLDAGQLAGWIDGALEAQTAQRGAGPAAA